MAQFAKSQAELPLDYFISSHFIVFLCLACYAVVLPTSTVTLKRIFLSLAVAPFEVLLRAVDAWAYLHIAWQRQRQ